MWKITRVHVDEEDDLESRVGYTEQHSRISTMAVMLGEQSVELPGDEFPTIKFRTLDDDDTVIYSGWLHDDPECLNQDAALKFAESDYGCTYIQVKRDGEWKVEIS